MARRRRGGGVEAALQLSAEAWRLRGGGVKAALQLSVPASGQRGGDVEAAWTRRRDSVEAAMRRCG